MQGLHGPSNTGVTSAYKPISREAPRSTRWDGGTGLLVSLTVAPPLPFYFKIAISPPRIITGMTGAQLRTLLASCVRRTDVRKTINQLKWLILTCFCDVISYLFSALSKVGWTAHAFGEYPKYRAKNEMLFSTLFSFQTIINVVTALQESLTAT